MGDQFSYANAINQTRAATATVRNIPLCYPGVCRAIQVPESSLYDNEVFRALFKAPAKPKGTPVVMVLLLALITVKPLYTDIRYNDKIRYSDNLNGMIP